jgi:hypothetical protein
VCVCDDKIIDPSEYSCDHWPATCGGMILLLVP